MIVEEVKEEILNMKSKYIKEHRIAINNNLSILAEVIGTGETTQLAISLRDIDYDRTLYGSICSYGGDDCKGWDIHKITTTLEDINRMTSRRKVLITDGMSNEILLFITDAPAQAIIDWCYHYNQEKEDGNDTFLDFLEERYYVNLIFDSESELDLEGMMDDIDIIGFDEEYDLSDYLDKDEQENCKEETIEELYRILDTLITRSPFDKKHQGDKVGQEDKMYSDIISLQKSIKSAGYCK